MRWFARSWFGGGYFLSLPTNGLLAYIVDGIDSIGESVTTPFVYIPTFAGTETLTLAHLTGSETVDEKVGTSTATIVTGSISFSAGTVGYLLLSDGTELIFEGDPNREQATVYNIDGTGRHGTLVGANAAPFDTASSTVKHLATHGGAIDVTTGTELSFSINNSTAENQILDLGNNTFRWVGDGSTFSYIRFVSFATGATYRIIPTVLDYVSGGIKGSDAADSDLFAAFTSTPDPIDDEITNKIEFGRAVGGQAIDITVQFSVQRVIDDIVPAMPGASNDVLGNPLSFSGPMDIGYPGYVNFSADAPLIAADNLLTSPFLFTAGTPNNIAPEDWSAFAGGNLENVMFHTPKGTVIYGSRQSPANASKVLRYLGASPTLKIGIFTDNHYADDVTVNTTWVAQELKTEGVHAVMHLGDNYEASLDGGWTTLGEMQADIAAYEALFADWDSRNKSFSAGNHTFPTYGGFDDFFAESTLVTENSVKVIWDIAVINIFNAGPPDYTADATALAFLATEIENARLRGNRIILQMHVPINSPSSCIQASDIISLVSTGISNGAEFLAVFTGHEHNYELTAITGATPHYVLDGLRETKVAYLLGITAAGFSLESITE